MKTARARSFWGGRAFRRSSVPVALGALVLGALAQHCSSTTAASSSSCQDDPLQCAAGSTCWVKDCTCPSQVNPCVASKCTKFDFACLASKPSAAPGDNCIDSIGRATCGDGQWCLQEMDAGEGDGGVCVPYCDPSMAGSCAGGYACTEIGVALVPSAPVVHVCQVIGSDAGLPTVGNDGGEPEQGSDASEPDGSRDHLLFDALPP